MERLININPDVSLAAYYRGESNDCMSRWRTKDTKRGLDGMEHEELCVLLHSVIWQLVAYL